MLSRIVIVIGMMLAAGGSAAAHPGHGAGGGSFELSHYLTEPVHVSVLLALAAVGVGAAIWNGRYGQLVRRWTMRRRR